MEKRFTDAEPLLDSEGRPNPGWASSGILKYKRADIKARPWRIKEWDWYQISDHKKALQFTFGHAGYAGQVGIMFFDFEKGQSIFTKDKILVLPFGSLNLGANAEEDGVLLYDKGGMYMRLETKGDTRILDAKCEGFEANVTMKRQNPHSLVLSVPFDEHEKAFYYNQKISCMKGEATVYVNGQTYTFQEDAWGLLDWGRGVWPFHNEWYWSSATGYLGEEVFGFNLGCGFGNTSLATENCLFYKDEIHKLSQVHIDTKHPYTDPWHFKDVEGRLDIDFHPIYDRETKIKLLWIDNCTHQMFGKFNGTVILDDGTKLEVNNVTGFAEHAINNW